MANIGLTLLDGIFETRWFCEVDLISLLAIQKLPDFNDPNSVAEFIEPAYRPRVGIPGHNEGVIAFETNADEELLDTYYGYGRSRLNNEYMQQMNQSTKQTLRLTIAEIAEIIADSGSITLLTPKDSAMIYSSINEYLDFISKQMGINAHFKSPPKEDLEKLKQVSNMIETLARHFIAQGTGDDIFSALVRAFSNTAVGLNDTGNNSKVILNGKENIAQLSDDRINEDILNPYSFSKFKR